MSFQSSEELAKMGSENLNKGLDVEPNQIQAFSSLFCDGLYFGHVEFALRTGRISPEEFIKNMKPEDLDKTGFLVFLGFLIRNGLNVNYYFKGPYSTDIHIAAYIYSLKKNSKQSKYIFDMLESAGSSYYLQAYTGNRSISTETVESIIGYTRLNTDDNYTEFNAFFSLNLSLSLKWGIMKDILLDTDVYRQNDKDLTDFLDKLDVKTKFIMRTIILYLIIYSGAMNTLQQTKDACLYKNTLGNMEMGVYFAINSQNYNIFKTVLDKGVECNYLCMTELICRHHLASKINDKILSENFAKMIEYAVLTGAEIDNYLLQFFMVSGSSEILETIRNNYSEPKWKKYCNIAKSEDGSQLTTKKLRQIAFNLNIDFSLTPSQICEKLDQINNEDRMDFVKKSINRQEDRVVKNLVEAGKVKKNENLNRIRCNFRSTVLNNPYAYNDARMAFYRSQQGEVWCFTSDFFESMIKSKKNPYNGENLPSVFVETIKAQLNILKLMDLYHVKDNKNIEESLKETFEQSGKISNKYSEEIYTTAVNLYRLYTMESEIDFREKSLGKNNVLEKFIFFSFFFSVDCEYNIHTDFSNRNPGNSGDMFGKPFAAADVIKFKIYDMMKNTATNKFFTNNKSFSELLLRIISYNLVNLEKCYTKGILNEDERFYTNKNNQFKDVVNYVFS